MTEKHGAWSILDLISLTTSYEYLQRRNGANQCKEREL